MVFWFMILFVIYLIWVLLFKGFLWKLIIFIAGWIGIYLLLPIYFPNSMQTAITITGNSYSWAMVIPTAICLLALVHIRN